MINNNNRKWWTLGTVCFVLFMILLDGNVVNLAIPKIMGDFAATISQVEWVNNAYLLSFAILLITLGRLGDTFGRKLMFLSGLAVFTISSALCGGSDSVGQLVFFRIIQGIGAASMMPATLSLITTNFKKEERGTAMGIWGAVSGLAIVLGPIIGGYLTDTGLGGYLNDLLNITQYWRYVFYINIPIGIIAFLFGMTVIPESRDKEKKHNSDILGIFLSASSLFLLTYAFIEGSAFGWLFAKKDFLLFGSKIAIGSIGAIPIFFVLSIILMILFIWHESRVKKDPLMDLSLFKSRNFSVGSFAGAVLNFAMMGSFFLLPLFLQSILGYSAIKTGQVLLPLALAIMVFAPIAGKLSDKIGSKFIVMSGMIVMAIGGFLLANFSLDTTSQDLIIPFVVMGIGMGLAMSPLTNITLYDAPDDEAGGASGVFSTTRQIGSVMGIAILGALLQTAMISNIEMNISNISSLTSGVKTAVTKVVDGKDFSMSDKKSQEELAKTLSDAMVLEAREEQAEKMSAIPNVMKLDPAYQVQLKTKQVEEQNILIEKIKSAGLEITRAGKQGFVDSINYTFSIAAIIALFGALVTMLFKNNKKA